MVSLSLLAYVLLHLLNFSESSLFDFFNHLDVNLLDDKDFCEIVTTLPHFQDDYWFDDLPMFVSFRDQTCQPALIIKLLRMRIESLDESCDQRNNYIKDPNVTYLFVNDEQHNLRDYFDKDLFAKLPCILENQPYFFTMTTIENNLTIDEIQVFSKSIQLVAKYEKIETVWKVRESMPDIFQRRSNFHGNEVIAHYDDFEKYGIIDGDGNFIGYHGDIGTLVQQAFNFSLDLHPIQSYGVKRGINEYTGTVNDLYKHEIDIAMGNFNHNTERLEVTEGGFSSYLVIPELIFWNQDSNHKFIYAMVFDNMTWIAIVIMILLSSFGYFFFHIDNKCMETILEATALSIKVLLVLGIEQFSLRKTTATRTLLLTISLSGALFYWFYTGALVSYFTIDSEKPPIASFEDILDIPSMKLLMLQGSSESQYIINAMNKDPKLKDRLPKSIVWYDNNKDMYMDFMKEESKHNVVIFKYFSFTLASLVSLRESNDANSLCKIRHGLLDNIRTKEYVGWLYPKNSLLKRLFDKFIIRLNEEGIERKLFLEHFVALDEDKCETETKAIHFHIVVTLFKSLALGIFIACIVLNVEIVFMRLKSQNVQ